VMAQEKADGSGRGLLASSDPGAEEKQNTKKNEQRGLHREIAKETHAADVLVIPRGDDTGRVDARGKKTETMKLQRPKNQRRVATL